MSESDLTKLILLYNAKMTALRARNGSRLDKQVSALKYALTKLEA